MKPITIIVVIIAIIWAFNCYTSAFIGDSSHEMMGYITEVKKAAKGGDMYRVNEQVGRLHAGWESAESRWEMLVDHREVETIDTLMTHLVAMAGTGALDDLMPDLEELDYFFAHIDDKHKIRLENIL